MISIWMALGGILVAFGVGALSMLAWAAKRVDIKPWS